MSGYIVAGAWIMLVVVIICLPMTFAWFATAGERRRLRRARQMRRDLTWLDRRDGLR